MSTASLDPSATSISERAPLKSWLAVVGVAIATFAMVTVEALPVGLLTSIGGALGVSEGTAGLSVMVPGLVASITAPILPVAIRRLDRRVVLLGLIMLMTAANLLSAAAPDFAVLLGSRFLVGISIGGFWALAASVAARLVPEKHIPRAMSLAFGGATAANVLGVPAGTLVGGLTDWRVAFVTVAGLGVLVAIALHSLLPKLPATSPVRLRTLAEQLRNSTVRAGVVATFLLVGGHWAAFTFVSPILQTISGIDEKMIGPLQLGFGAAGILGTVVAGATAGRDARKTLVAAGILLAGSLALFPIAGGTAIGGATLLVVWGLAFGAVPVGVQTWILQAAPDAAEAATALNTSVYNLAIALGALLGGIVVTMVTVTGVLWFGAVLSILTLLAVWRVRTS